jgi:hypothetical protein
MTPLPDEPKVIVWVEGSSLMGVGTNVSPDTLFIFAYTEEDFLKYSQGLPFVNSVLDQNPIKP